jgi:AraC-like DNA-binding protein
VHINRLFKQAMGITLNEYFIRVKIKTAAYLLTNSNLTTLDIASKIGYSSLSYFNKAFKAIYGCSPREYTRKKSSNKK